MLKVLVLGGGGREHAIAWKLSQSPKVSRVYLAPGNGGSAAGPKLENLALADSDSGALCQWAQEQKIALTVVGPEGPLAAGVVDAFRARGLRIFGPTRAAAQLESSKSFSKAFMRRHGIPTADYQCFRERAAAHAFVERLGAPVVIKADGLAAGKGVVVAQSLPEAHAAVDAMLPAPGAPGRTADRNAPLVVIEQFLAGEEASFIVLSDGKNVLALASSQDHKRLLDGDRGPNTGGMGAYSPAPVVSADVHARSMREIILPTIRGMEKEGTPYTGFLYAGLMIDSGGHPRALEFNCRMGDPETQAILMRLKSDFVDALNAGVDGKLDQIELQWDRRTALGVVLAAPGYPDAPRTGGAITGLPAQSDSAMVFHAATALHGGQLQTSGGRVLCVTALADGVRQAQQRAYELVRGIHFDGVQYRHDIGHRAIK